VLLVDDSIVVRKVLTLTLRQMPEFFDADIDEAANGKIALERIAEQPYDLILSDIRMPHVDGLELVRRVRRDLNDSRTPIVLVSTLGRDEDVKEGLDAGATAYVLKPLSPHHIMLTLRKVLREIARAR
jgi:CheY-like chemotaxis protein